MGTFLPKHALSLILLLLISEISYAQGTTQGITSVVSSSTTNIQESSDTRPYPFYQPVTLGAIRAYQLLISPSKGSSCPMYPHCSLYAYQAFKQYSPIKAFLMTADRLHRCGHDLDNYEPIEVTGLVRFLDPITPSLADSEPNPDDQKSLNISCDSGVPGDDSSDDAHLFHFAEMLQSEGNYDYAVIEYRRLLFYFPNSHYREQALKSVLYCYYKAEQYLSAIHWGQDLLGKGMDLTDADELKFLVGASYFKVGNYPRARNYFTEVANTNNGNYGEKGLLLQGLSYAKEASWDYAEKSFARIDSDSKFSDEARQCEKLSQDGKNLGLKSHVIAGVLAIVPGLGYLYDGYKQTALSSFIVNSLFIWGTVEAFRKDDQSMGTMLSILSFGWYAGNIYGSVMSAERRNIKLKNDLLLKFNVGFQF